MDYKMQKFAEINIDNLHKPVLLEESIKYLCPMEDGVYIDATMGLGGHTKSLIEACNNNAKIIGMDVDENALNVARERLAEYQDNIVFVNKNYINIDNTISDLNIKKVNGIIADLGLSSFQLDHSGKGFSFNKNEPLDMRMDASLQFTAYDLVNEMDQSELENIFKIYGEERFSRNISKSIIKNRVSKPIQTSSELAALVSNSIPKKFHPKRIHPATKTFQALRIAINNELENLKIFIEKAIKILKPGGRIVIISFHSLEDRIIKKTFKKFHSPCICPPDLPICSCGNIPNFKIINKSPIRPQESEIIENPRARSAKMRVGEKIEVLKDGWDE